MITEEELIETGEASGFSLYEIQLVSIELQRFAELVEGKAIHKLLSAPEGYIMYTPCRLH